MGVLLAIAGLPTSMSVSSISPAVICSSAGWRRRNSMLCCTSGSRCSCGHSVCTVAPRSSANSTADFTAGPVPVTMTYKSKSCKMSKGCMRRCLCSKPMHICLKEPDVPSGPPGRDPPDVASFWQGTDIWTTFCVLLLQLEAGPKLTVVLQPALWRGLRAANKKFDLIHFGRAPPDRCYSGQEDAPGCPVAVWCSLRGKVLRSSAAWVRGLPNTSSSGRLVASEHTLQSAGRYWQLSLTHILISG